MYIFRGAPDIIITSHNKPEIIKSIQPNMIKSVQPNMIEQTQPNLLPMQEKFSSILTLDSQDMDISQSASPCSDWSDDSIVDVEGIDEDINDSEEDASIEVCRASLTLHDVTRLPEKLGQLIAELHFLLVAKFVRHFHNKRAALPVVRAKGCLIDRLNGIVHCCLSARMCSPENPELISPEFITMNGAVLRSTLCHSIQILTSQRDYIFD